MSIALAVSPTVKTPGIYMTVNLLAGAISAGSSGQIGLIMAPRSTSGNLTVDTEIRLISGADDAKAAWGTKTPGYKCALNFFSEYPNGRVFGIAPTASGGAAATGSVTFASTPSVTQNVRFAIAGRTLDVPWAAGEDGDVIKARSISAINARDDIPVTATSGGFGIVSLTFPVPGPWGNDVQYSVLVSTGTGGTGTATGSSLTGGTTEPDFTNALSSMSAKYDYICPCLSNADAQSSGATSNVARLKTHINGMNTGLNASLQQAIIGMTGTQSAAKVGAIARNEATIEFPFCMNGQGLPAELAGEELGSRMYSVSLDAAANRIGTHLPEYIGAKDLVADTPTPSETEDALSNGLSIVSYDRQGGSVLVRPITSHSQDTNGNPDNRCFDVSAVDGAYAVANDIEQFLPQEFPRAKISKDLQPGDEPLPAGVIEERDIKASLIKRLNVWARLGIVRRDKLAEVIADGSLIVQVDPSDETQVDIVIPLGIVKPLAKFGIVVNKVA